MSRLMEVSCVNKCEKYLAANTQRAASCSLEQQYPRSSTSPAMPLRLMRVGLVEGGQDLCRQANGTKLCVHWRL